MTTTVDTDLYGAVEDAAAHLYVWALKDIPHKDLRDALAAAREKETSTTGRRVLDVIHKNVSIADEQKNLVCQDTGIAVYTCRVGEGFPLHPARIYQALKGRSARRSSIRCARTPSTRSRARTPAPTLATACRSCTGSSSSSGTAST